MNKKQIIATVLYGVVMVIIAFNINYFTLNLVSAASAGVIAGPLCLTIGATVIYINVYKSLK